jgi:antitoxin ParD1/3/4
MNVSLPNQMKNWVENKIQIGQYHNASEYVRDLIRKDQLEAERALAFRSAIDMGRNSGVDERPLDEIIAGAKVKAKQK